MKALILGLLLFPTIIFAQITVTQADFANAGDTVRMSAATEPSIDFSSTGSNWAWDFSMLVAESQTLYDYSDLSNSSFLIQAVYGTFAPPQYHASYFLPSDDLPLDQVGSFLPVTISDVVQFSKSSADSITSLGFGVSIEGTEVPFKSDTIETRYKFPMNFNDTYSSRGYTNMDLNPITNIIWKQFRQRNSEVDGWGSISTPYGTFNALRIKHSITEIDSMLIEFFGTPTWIGIPIPDSYIYEWYTNGEKDAVLRIETAGIIGNEVVRNIEFRDDFDPLLASVEEMNLNLEVYPNPAMESIVVSGANPGTSYSLVNSGGTVVGSGILDVNGEIDIHSLSKGTYLLVFMSGKNLIQKTFIKE